MSISPCDLDFLNFFVYIFFLSFFSKTILFVITPKKQVSINSKKGYLKNSSIIFAENDLLKNIARLLNVLKIVLS